MVEFTKVEQEEIINDSLNKIEVNDIISSCKCKLINEKTELTYLIQLLKTFVILIMLNARNAFIKTCKASFT